MSVTDTYTNKGFWDCRIRIWTQIFKIRNREFNMKDNFVLPLSIEIYTNQRIFCNFDTLNWICGFEFFKADVKLIFRDILSFDFQRKKKQPSDRQVF